MSDYLIRKEVETSEYDDSDRCVKYGVDRKFVRVVDAADRCIELTPHEDAADAFSTPDEAREMLRKLGLDGKELHEFERVRIDYGGRIARVRETITAFEVFRPEPDDSGPDGAPDQPQAISGAAPRTAQPGPHSPAADRRDAAREIEYLEKYCDGKKGRGGTIGSRRGR